MNRLVCTAVLALSLVGTTTSAFAAPILVPDTATVVGSIFLPIVGGVPGAPTFDVRGSAGAQVIEATTTQALGAVALLGPAEAFVPGGAGNNVLVLTDGSEALALVFDFSGAGTLFNPAFPGPLWINLVVGGPGPVTNPALVGFVGIDVASLILSGDPTPILDGETTVGLLFSYTLASISGTGDPVTIPTPVPEPATLTLLGTGLIYVARRRAKARK